MAKIQCVFYNRFDIKMVWMWVDLTNALFLQLLITTVRIEIFLCTQQASYNLKVPLIPRERMPDIVRASYLSTVSVPADVMFTAR